MVIIFDSRNWFGEVYAKMQKYFEDNPKLGVTAVSVFHNELEYKRFSRGIKNSILITDIFKEDQNLSLSLDDIEAKYNINLWSVIYSDRVLRHKDLSYQVKIVQSYFRAWEKIFEVYKPDLIVSETVSGIWNYTSNIIAKSRGIPYFGQLSSRMSNRYYFAKDIFGSFDEFEQNYNKYSASGLDEAQIMYTQNFVDNFRSRPNQPDWMKHVVVLPSAIKTLNPYKLIKDMIKDFRDIHVTKITDYYFLSRFKSTIYTIKELYRIFHFNFFNVFSNPVEGEKYLLFPLHFQPEASTDFWAPNYTDQVYVIKQIARSLPFNIKLYVKEHSAKLGTKSLKTYSEIRKLNNVKLINPYYNVFKLIEKCSAVILIANTTGLEAIILNKPVIVFGKTFYDHYPYLYKVISIKNLSETIKEALETEVDNYDIKRMTFIYSYLISGYSPDLFPVINSEDDIPVLCSNLLNEYKRYKFVENE